MTQVAQPVTLEYQGPWQSGDGVTDLMGNPLPANRFFFVSPPAEIGQVISAWSNVRQGRAPWPRWFRVLLTLAVGIAAAITLVALPGTSLVARSSKDACDVLAACAIGIAFVGAIYAAQGRKFCAYVGREGVALTYYHRQRKPQVLAFRDAYALRTAQTRHYYNGVYTGTSYDFAWYGGQAKRVYRLKGRYTQSKKLVKQNGPFNFALAAEIAWSNYYLPRAVEQLQRNGYAEFIANKSDAVRILPGAIEFVVKGQVVRMTRDELKKLTLAKGYLVAQHKDARWYSGQGKFSFPYAGISNARVMLLMLERLVGYSVQ